MKPIPHLGGVLAIASVVLGAELGLGAGCAPREQTPDETTPSSTELIVAVVNYPLAYFAGRIGARHVRVVFPAPADEDPAYWAPAADDVVSFQNADLILRNGASYARWMRTATLPASKVVDTSAGFTDRLIELEDDVRHTHGPGGEHEHGDVAFTTWLDPQLAALQVEAIRAAFSIRRPEATADFEANAGALNDDLRSLDEELGNALAPAEGRPLLFSHPVYQYLIRRFGLDDRSVHWEPEVAPDEKQWRELEAILENHPARWMIWEGPPLDSTRARLERLGVGTIIVEPCANVPPGEDYLDVMRRNVSALQGASIGATAGSE